MPFTPQTLDFLAENKLRNDKQWYQQHKPQFKQYVFEPLAELVTQLAPVVHEIDPILIAEPKTGKSISRVFRDTRFTKGPSLFREEMWCVFTRDKKAYTSAPGFFFELSPDGFRYGCGYFDAPPKVMEAIRTLIIKQDKSFLTAKQAYEKQNVFRMEGDFYKRVRYPEQPQDMQDWLQRKGISFNHNSKDFHLLFSPELHRTVAEGFRRLAPVYAFFLRARLLLLEKTGA